eukprot:CAMPEP_0181498626 /NCGR_PEP_ID=MMETSP1110-20121109/54205_1 /TAXON_ID=174948 /ORGANISM="Symbiodinium sp., Strain CCMP421" /LENGTH=47 /DNA_ID= /DNA_START= /DNA_END= /DNA_ORIENTATION=
MSKAQVACCVGGKSDPSWRRRGARLVEDEFRRGAFLRLSSKAAIMDS